MQTVKVNVKVDEKRTVTVQLPDDVETGDYEILLVLNNRSQDGIETAGIAEPVSSTSTVDDGWESWVQEVEQMPLSPKPAESEYQQHLVEKYRKQGLEL